MGVNGPLIELRDVGFAYAGRLAVLRGAALELRPGERLGLTGANGSGKSTLLRLIVGLLKPDRGEIAAFGSPRRTEGDFTEVRRRAGLVFQDPDDQLFCPTVLEDVAFGPLNLGRTPAEARAAAREALEKVGLAGFEERIAYRMSTGEKRLAAAAAVLAMQPEVLLLDEPMAGLDEDARGRLFDVLKGLDQAMILVSHDMSLVSGLSSRRVELRGGTIG